MNALKLRVVSNFNSHLVGPNYRSAVVRSIWRYGIKGGNGVEKVQGVVWFANSEGAMNEKGLCCLWTGDDRRFGWRGSKRERMGL
jgi:hypothetical protein